MNSDESREKALANLKHRRGLKKQLKMYVIANITLVIIWALSGQGDFWPVWSIVFWGLALIFQAWTFTFPENPITEEEISQEVKRLNR
tara:strand:- start:108 stop:371 length:264 start_codon:yes stop_codon:yes gene_type:complete